MVDLPLIFGILLRSYFSEPTQTIKTTWYEAGEITQNDAAPCRGASMLDICARLQEERVIALSQDLVGRTRLKPFTYGDWVFLKGSSPFCTGAFRILDTMNARYKGYGDIAVQIGNRGTNCSQVALHPLPFGFVPSRF